eukprot:5328525-Prymnesium_polylepis.1
MARTTSTRRCAAPKRAHRHAARDSRRTSRPPHRDPNGGTLLAFALAREEHVRCSQRWGEFAACLHAAVRPAAPRAAHACQ